VFLFDEPLSNLDARLRTEMRTTIRRLYDRLRVTSVYVTHDQVEAMTLGDMLVVMNQGQVHQVGTPEACYRKPADTFVASFLGSPAMNFLDARAEGIWFTLSHGARIAASADMQRVLESRPDAEVRIGIRPEDVHPTAPEPPRKAPFKLGARVILREPLGHETLTHLRLDGAPEGAPSVLPGCPGIHHRGRRGNNGVPRLHPAAYLLERYRSAHRRRGGARGRRDRACMTG
jgi:ABC-type sugar transport system ATPase subunit